MDVFNTIGIYLEVSVSHASVVGFFLPKCIVKCFVLDAMMPIIVFAYGLWHRLHDEKS